MVRGFIHQAIHTSASLVEESRGESVAGPRRIDGPDLMCEEVWKNEVWGID